MNMLPNRTMKNPIHPLRACFLLLLLAAVCMAPACGGSDDAATRSTACWADNSALSIAVAGEAGTTPMQLTGRTGEWYLAEIKTDGSVWCTFDDGTTKRNAGMTQERELVPIHCKVNRTGAERTATLSLLFSGGGSCTLTLTQEDAGPLPLFAAPEVPQSIASDDWIFVTHTAEMHGAEARNYSLCFDRTKAGAWWVAYPLASEGYTGSLPRVDEWTFDPEIAEELQANLTRYTYTDRDPLNNNGNLYDRGHQIPNADRRGHAEMQQQTFYLSNSTPQHWSLNQGQWADLEAFVRARNCADTLYVVTGAAWIGDTAVTSDTDGKPCPVPSHYFKVLLRTVAGNTRKAGDRLEDYTAGELQSIGFWVANSTQRGGYNAGSYRTWTRSVAEIEELLGGRFTFFPTLGDELGTAVKAQHKPSEWGL